MRHILPPAFAVVALFGCATNMWIPVAASPRPPVRDEQVAFLTEAPTREYVLIGIITPPADEYDTEAEAVSAMRHVAAKHGADAMFIESQTETSGWKFDAGILGAKGNATRMMSIRAKAIAWK